MEMQNEKNKSEKQILGYKMNETETQEEKGKVTDETKQITAKTCKKVEQSMCKFQKQTNKNTL